MKAMAKHSQCHFTLVFILLVIGGDADALDSKVREKRQTRLDLGAILGGLIQNAPKPPGIPGDPLSGIINGILDNVKFGVDDQGQINVNLGPRPGPPQPPTEAPTRAPQPVNVGPFNDNSEIDVSCMEPFVEYFGNDLNVPNNGRRNFQASEGDCMRSCQQTPGCQFWVYVTRRRQRGSCFLKSDKRGSFNSRDTISGPRTCGGGLGGGGGGGGGGSPCQTVGGGSPNQPCVLPFKYKGSQFNGCTLVDAGDGIPWCSVRVDGNQEHIGGQGLWGHCASSCPQDAAGTPIGPVIVPTTTTTTTTTTPPPPPPQKACGANARKFQIKIVGGRPADPDEWPWLAALIRPSATASGQYCGGALINERFVLTAAHCIARFTKEQIKITLGEYSFSETGETNSATYEVENMKMHEGYNSVSYENDIALLKLARNADINKSVYPICLPSKDKDFTNQRAYVIGWGTINFGGPTSSVLQEVDIRVWDNKECSANYNKLNRDISGSMMCAADPGKDACQGDSGGPLNCLDFNTANWELCGVVSWGARCAEKDYPGVYTRVTSFLDWIEANQKTL